VLAPHPTQRTHTHKKKLSAQATQRSTLRSSKPAQPVSHAERELVHLIMSLTGMLAAGADNIQVNPSSVRALPRRLVV